MATTVPPRSSWADDDSLPDSEPQVVGYASNNSDTASRFSGQVQYRITYTKHPTTYARTLYDVDGYVLTDEDGKPVNVFTAKMKHLLEKGDIICYHVPGRPGYRYFCTNKRQGDAFRKSRKRGFASVSRPYHVYPDEPGCVLPHESRTVPPTAI